jgi:hypothetical protein
MGFIGGHSLVGFIGLGLVGSIGLYLVSLVGLIRHMIGLNGLNGFNLVGLSGPSDIMGLISLGLVSLVELSLGYFSGWLACARKKMWYSNNNDTLQDCFTAAVLAAAARMIFQQCMQAAWSCHGVKRYQNYQCSKLLCCFPLVCEGELVVLCAFVYQ